MYMQPKLLRVKPHELIFVQHSGRRPNWDWCCESVCSAEVLSLLNLAALLFLKLGTQVRKTAVTGRWIFLHLTRGTLDLWNGVTSVWQES